MGRVTRRRIVVEGLVQGVGFRPFVYREAMSLGLVGRVRNDGSGVIIDVEGEAGVVRDFVHHIGTRAPANASITMMRVETAPARRYPTFSITDSDPGTASTALVSADVATCDACVRELCDPRDRRFRYPFLNCTSCGPRFTIQQELPYDRHGTTMSAFAMCGACAAEYADPVDRRFHAQPIACGECGPQLSMCAPDGSVREVGDAALMGAVAAIRGGNIVAVKGLGGYHLACDATAGVAVARLRARKGRDAKPFAVLVRDVVAAERFCRIGVDERALLESPARPIVLLRVREAGTGVQIAADVAPGNRWLGVMLPYTPLHHLLTQEISHPIVLTSGNRAAEPIVTTDQDAVEKLGGIADVLLMHNRRITIGCDDSVMRIQSGAPSFIRRSRGFAPLPVSLPRALLTPALAVGGMLKNTFCLARGTQAFLSPHIGDLENPTTYGTLQQGIEHYIRLFGAEPRVIAHDMHPDYLSTRVAHALECDTRIAVQHHHAHVAGCVAEHSVDAPVLGVAFDGAGLGDDGAIWGGEFLLVDNGGYERVGHLSYVPLPGGDAAARHPLRMAASHLMSAYGSELSGSPVECGAWFSDTEWRLLRGMIGGGVLSPPTSSAGRLFDAVAALSGASRASRFEGEAAARLECMVDPGERGAYPFDVQHVNGCAVADCSSLIRAVAQDAAGGVGANIISARFHNALCVMIVSVAVSVRQQTGVHHVALTGGVFQNAHLVERAAASLRSQGFTVLLHRQVPCNDGGLSYGQIAVTAAHLEHC
ncbi:MAG: carbamoyltransferase HypF [Longimicrobiales bacterium]